VTIPFEERVERALWDLEIKGELEKALAEYRAAAKELEAALAAGDIDEAEAKRVLSYGYMRQANVVRQAGEMDLAKQLGDQSIQLGRESGDDLSLARALLNHSATLAMTGDDSFKGILKRARLTFGKGSSDDFVQGVGWCHLLESDLIGAGLLPGGPETVIAVAKQALDVLEPIGNWQGVVRALTALQKAQTDLGNDDQAAQLGVKLEAAKAKAESDGDKHT